MGWTMDIGTTFHSICQNVAQERQNPFVSLNDALPLSEARLNFLCMAATEARMEDQLGFGPSSSGEDFEFPMIMGNFIKQYEGAAASKVE